MSGYVSLGLVMLGYFRLRQVRSS